MKGYFHFSALVRMFLAIRTKNYRRAHRDEFIWFFLRELCGKINFICPLPIMHVGARIGIFLGLLFLPLCGFSEEPVQVGFPFTVSVPVQVERQALGALRSYFDLFIASRPIPDGYLLESYKSDQEKGLVKLTGRVLNEGKYTLFFGTFVCGSTVYQLPPVTIEASPLSGTTLSPKDMLLPFPELALNETKENRSLKTKLLGEYLDQGAHLLLQQKDFKNGLLVFLLMVCSSPILLFLIGQKIKQMKPKEKEIPLEEELVMVKKSKDWTKLLALLQRLSGKKESLTSYELTQFFSEKGKQDLVQASSFVEKYGYLLEPSSEKFDQAIKYVAASKSFSEIAFAGSHEVGKS